MVDDDTTVFISGPVRLDTGQRRRRFVFSKADGRGLTVVLTGDADLVEDLMARLRATARDAGATLLGSRA